MGFGVYAIGSGVRGDGEMRFTFQSITTAEAPPHPTFSPSTMKFDRGGKLDRYFKFDSLQHVIILYQNEYRAEMWTRSPEGTTDTDVDGNLL